MNKPALVEQLQQHLRTLARGAHRASADSAEEAQAGATSREKRVDARVAIENASLARGHRARALRAENELRSLEGFRPAALSSSDRIDVGAIVEIEDVDTGEGRTLFLAPVGAGVTLSGPGGDGLFSVVTPSSPMGRALRGHRLGDIVDLVVAGEPREWRVTWVA